MKQGGDKAKEQDKGFEVTRLFLPGKWAARFSVMFACGAILGLPASAAQIEALSKPYAILVYADWCFNCKQIIPRLDKLLPRYADRIEFERFDMTNEDRKLRSRQRAKDLGVGPIYFANKGTGVVLLIDRKREKVGELRYTLSDEQMIAELDALAAGKPVPQMVPAAEAAAAPQ